MFLQRLLPLAYLATLSLASCEKDDTTPAPAALVGQRWQLVQVDAFPLGASSYSPTTQSYLEFTVLGSCTVGLGPCNNFSGRFTLGPDGEALRITPQIATRTACPVQPLETQYLDNLALTARYEIGGGELRLYDGQRATPRLVFRAPAR